MNNPRLCEFVMRAFTKTLGIALSLLLFSGDLLAESEQPGKSDEKPFRIVVVGDTGIGVKAFNKGFKAVMDAIRKTDPNPDLLIHVGDYIYPDKELRDGKKVRKCRQEDIDEYENELVRPFKDKLLFIRGDNDLELDCKE